MSAYQLLYRVTVEHDYFTDRACKSLQFVPTPATARLLNRPDLLLRVTDNHLSVYFDGDQLDKLRAAAEDNLVFIFKVFSGDANFARYTLPVSPVGNTILYFDRQQSGQDASGRQLLHAESNVSSEDYAAIGAGDEKSAVIGSSLEPRDYHVKPCFILNMTVAADDVLLSPQTLDKQRRFYISFASSASFWKYYLMDELAERSLYIADQDDGIEFEDVGLTNLPGNRSARMLRSRQAIPLNERPVQRLQLRENANARDTIVIKRLPNASIGQIHAETVNGKLENILEIYIH